MSGSVTSPNVNPGGTVYATVTFEKPFGSIPDVICNCDSLLVTVTVSQVTQAAVKFQVKYSSSGQYQANFKITWTASAPSGL